MQYHPVRSGYMKACRLTEGLLRQHGITRRPVAIERIIANYGIEIVERPLKLAPALFDWLTKTIYIRPMSEQRRRFYLGHELGHYILPPDYHELSCNTFSACLLMPHEWILADLRRASLTVLADWYKVTLPVLRIRLQQIGLKSRVKVPF